MEQFLIRTIFISTVSLGQVEYRFHDSLVVLYKKKILFAKVNEEDLYVLSTEGNFIRINKLLGRDNISLNLKQAYRNYCQT